MRDLSKLLQRQALRDVYDQQSFITEFAVEINRLMELRGMSRVELANQLGTSKANVTQLLSGERNLTAKNIERILRALNGVFSVRPAENVQSAHAVRDENPQPKGRTVIEQKRNTGCKIVQWEGREKRQLGWDVERAVR